MHMIDTKRWRFCDETTVNVHFNKLILWIRNANPECLEWPYYLKRWRRDVWHSSNLLQVATFLPTSAQMLVPCWCQWPCSYHCSLSAKEWHCRQHPVYLAACVWCLKVHLSLFIFWWFTSWYPWLYWAWCVLLQDCLKTHPVLANDFHARTMLSARVSSSSVKVTAPCGRWLGNR